MKFTRKIGVAAVAHRAATTATETWWRSTRKSDADADEDRSDNREGSADRRFPNWGGNLRAADRSRARNRSRAGDHVCAELPGLHRGRDQSARTDYSGGGFAQTLR